MAESRTGMEKGEMRRLIAQAHSAGRDPLNLAFAGTREPNIALLLMDKTRAPRALMATLEKEFPDAKDARFGTGTVDAAVDPKLLLVLIPRKAPNGYARRLVMTLKGTGITKVHIGLEDDPVPYDTHESEEADASEAEPPAPGVSVADLQRGLAELLPRVAAADARIKPQAIHLAQETGGLIKQAALDQAQASLAALRTLLDQAPAPVAPVAAPDMSATYAKSHTAWLAARQHIETDLERLRAALAAEYADTADGAAVLSSYQQRVAPVLATFDTTLADLLDTASKTEDATQRGALIVSAQSALHRYRDYLASETLITDLDENPFAPLAIRKVVTATLAALEPALR